MINREGRSIKLYVIKCLPLSVLEYHLLSTVLYGILGCHLVSNLVVLIAQSCFDTIQASGKVGRGFINILEMLILQMV
jgi:hypothetical protein